MDVLCKMVLVIVVWEGWMKIYLKGIWFLVSIIFIENNLGIFSIIGLGFKLGLI